MRHGRLLACLLGCGGVLAACAADAGADHLPATPRKVVESQIGALRVGAPLPQGFLACKPVFSSEFSEHYYYVADPQHPDGGTRLEISAECQDGKGRPAPCGVGAVRVADTLTVTAEPGYDLPAADVCPLPVPLASLKTSRGVRLGDRSSAVQRAYGPPSAKVGPRRRFAELSRVLYTRSSTTEDGPGFEFAMRNRSVVEIRVYAGD